MHGSQLLLNELECRGRRAKVKVPPYAVMIVPVLIALLSAPTIAATQTPTPAMVENHIKAWVAAYTAHDAEGVARLDPPANGFGFRDLPFRASSRPMTTYVDGLRTFFAGMDYYRI